MPEGFIRVAYDADTEVYTFRDSVGTLYKGAPGARYGVLTPINDSTGSTRRRAFNSGTQGMCATPFLFTENLCYLLSDKRKGLPPVSPDDPPKSFHDILPSNCITAPSSPVDRPSFVTRASTLSNSPARTSMRVKFMETARKTALPKMQGVVHNLRRSKTTASSFSHTTSEEAKHLLRRGLSTLTRSTSRATTFSSVSVEEPTDVSSSN